MLFLLTGEKQTGKTRWLERVIEGLEQEGVCVAGVLAPGVWREFPDGTREKQGIDNLLLPHHTLIPFGRRADLARAEDGFARESQSARAGLGWIFPDSALDAVNAHCASLHDACVSGGFLVIDELGPLELLRDGGLIEAMRLLEAGSTTAFPHALAIVRESLLPAAHERFDEVWAGAVREIFPQDCSENEIISLYK